MLERAYPFADPVPGTGATGVEGGTEPGVAGVAGAATVGFSGVVAVAPPGIGKGFGVYTVPELAHPVRASATDRPTARRRIRMLVRAFSDLSARCADLCSLPRFMAQ